MANKKISELDPVTSLEDTDLVPVVTDLNTIPKSNKITWENLKSFLIGGNTSYGGTVVTNLDTITKTGFYTCYGTATGVPNEDYSWFILHQNSNVGTVSATQRAIAYLAGNPLIYERVKIDSTWGSWYSPIKDVVQDTTPQLGGDLDTNAKNIVLAENSSIDHDPSLSADGKYTGLAITGTAGAALAFGDLVTLDKDDSKWKKVDISVAAAATGDARGIIGICVLAANEDAATKILLNGVIRADANFPTLTIGAAVYASTGGNVVVAQPSTTDYVIRIVGYGLTADSMYFNPENDWITHVA